MLVLVPSMVVESLGSEEIESPFRFHFILIGSSPEDTTQINCANFPSSTGFAPKENGTICGGSKNYKNIDIYFQCLYNQLPFTIR